MNNSYYNNIVMRILGALEGANDMVIAENNKLLGEIIIFDVDENIIATINYEEPERYIVKTSICIAMAKTMRDIVLILQACKVL